MDVLTWYVAEGLPGNYIGWEKEGEGGGDCSMVGSGQTRPSSGYPNQVMANTISILVNLALKVTWLTLKFSKNIVKMSEKNELALQFWG